MVSRSFVVIVVVVAVTCLVGLSLPRAAAAQDAPVVEPEGWAYDVAAEMMSPFCPGRTIADCPSSAAKSLVLWLIVQESAGRTRADVEQELYDRYGDQIRPAPRAEGFGLAAYVLPVLAFAGGGLLVFAYLYRNTRHEDAVVSPTPLDPELERIVDREIAG
jgi:cytochrome c-type biogenesis protein CcmH/NrfF